MLKMMKAIKDDVQSGAHGTWKKVYKKICGLMNKSDQQDQGVWPCLVMMKWITVSCMPRWNQNIKYSNIIQNLTLL
jgi:hypothetical protein